MFSARGLSVKALILFLCVVCFATGSARHATADQSDQQPTPVVAAQQVFRPLVAAIYEPRMGFQYQPSIQRVRLDIGYSADVWTLLLSQEHFGSSREETVAVGLDGFTYTRLRSEANLKFPVEAVDYMFGINSTYRLLRLGENSVAVRMRLSHISAHFADGYADSTGMLRQRPFVYSREFIDAIVAHEWFVPNVRIYGGATYLLTVKELPRPVGRLIPQLGVEWYWKAGIPMLLGYDLRVVPIGGVSVPAHSLQVGVALKSGLPTLAVCGYFYSGYSIHGMFFDQRERYWALGVQVLI
ncbi:MAG: DUF1207 domain-containing protein [Chlorobi bacterium]|nr:DUF1207 domain-containing protein [Chlorobiota bacterium]